MNLFSFLNLFKSSPFTHCNGYAKKCPQKPKFDGHRFDFLSIIPKVYYSFKHIMRGLRKSDGQTGF